MVNKALPIATTLNSGYLSLFLFDNATNYFVFVQDILCTIQINKETERQQFWLHNQ